MTVYFPTLAAAPTLTWNQVGIWLGVFMLLAGFYFAWRKHQRAESDSKEPKHNPPLHRQYATKDELSELSRDVQTVEDKVDELQDDVDQKFHLLNTDMNERFRESALANSASRDKMYTSIRNLEQTAAHLDEKTAMLLRMEDGSREELLKVRDRTELILTKLGEIEQINQRVHRVETKLDNHIAKGNA